MVLPSVVLRKVPRAPLVLFRGHKHPHLASALKPLDPVMYDPKQRLIYLEFQFIWRFLFFWARTRSAQIAAVLAFLKVAETDVICMMENTDKLASVAKGLRWSDYFRQFLSVQMVKVQHGQDLRRSGVAKTRYGILAVWGASTARTFPSFGRSEEYFVVTGPLQDARYRELRSRLKTPKRRGLCIVSTVKDTEWWGPPVTVRRRGYDALMSYVARYSSDSGLPVSVALTVDRSIQNGEDQAKLERDYFVTRFGNECFFPDTSRSFGGLVTDEEIDTFAQSNKMRFSSYVLTDACELTIGATGSTLWESFGRGNRVLAVNLTDDPAFDFPIAGPWAMRQPSYESFSARCDELRNMSEEEYLRLSATARRDLIHYDECDRPAARLLRLVRLLLESKSAKTAIEALDTIQSA